MANIETRIQDFATEAADAFLNRSVDLNATIRKIASRESLNREKVARVVEEANRQVFLKVFDKQAGADRTVTFPVADTSKIVDQAPAKVASGTAAMVRVTRPVMTKAASEKSASQMDFERSLSGAPIQVAKDYLDKAILALEIYREKAAMALEKVKNSEVAFAKEAQRMVALEGYTYPELATAMVELRPKFASRIALLLKAAAAHMGERFHLPEDFEKKASAAIDAGEHDVVTQISCSKLPVEVINGSHKLVVSLDTLISQVTEADRANKNLWGADDTVKYLRNEVRNYLATHRSA